MSAITKRPLATACIFTWIGFVCAISFMEAWLKFRAPGVTLSIGLGIGQLVFNVLNKVEWVFAAAIMISVVSSRDRFLSTGNICLFVVIFILVLQTVWLLPALDARASLYINNKPTPPSNLHFYFVAAEILKVGCLFISGIKQFKRNDRIPLQ